jgi:PAS domain S-box-containing protein
MQQQLHTFSTPSPEQMVDSVAMAAIGGDTVLSTALESLPAPVYVTDIDGWVTAFNSACIDFAGRTPVAGQDRWCVTWRLYTEEGAPLPHEKCPMAVAIRERRQVRGMVALAERPDGSRVMFVPHPTPLFDGSGAMVGAVNILIDVTDERQAGSLLAQAKRCRRLAQSVGDSRTVNTLLGMAEEYEAKARALQQSELA